MLNYPFKMSNRVLGSRTYKKQLTLTRKELHAVLSLFRKNQECTEHMTQGLWDQEVTSQCPRWELFTAWPWCWRTRISSSSMPLPLLTSQCRREQHLLNWGPDWKIGGKQKYLEEIWRKLKIEIFNATLDKRKFEHLRLLPPFFSDISSFETWFPCESGSIYLPLIDIFFCSWSGFRRGGTSSVEASTWVQQLHSEPRRRLGNVSAALKCVE